MYLIKVDQLATTDSGLSAFLNSAPAAPSFQIFNTDIINCLWWFKESLYLLSHEYSYTTVQLPLYQQSETITKHLTSVVEPLYSEIARNLEATLLKMHKEDYNKYACIILFIFLILI